MLRDGPYGRGGRKYAVEVRFEVESMRSVLKHGVYFEFGFKCHGFCDNEQQALLRR